MDWPKLIMQLSIWSILLPLAAGFLFFRRLDEPSRIIFYVVILASVPQILTAAMPDSKNLNIVYNIYTPLEFIFIYFLVGNKYTRPAFINTSRALVIAFFLLTVIIVVRFGLYDKFRNELVCAADTVYLIWIFMFILQGLLTDQKLMNHRLPMFWFISGLLIYAPCTIFVFALMYYIDTSTVPFIKNLWSIHGVFNTLMYCLFAIGLFKNHRLEKAKAGAR
jgi:hypothetical protein